MATRPPSRCTQCRRLATNRGRCDQHQVKPWQNPSANTKTLTGWQRTKFRTQVLAHYGPECNWPGCTAPATEADHITPISQGGHPTDWEQNGQALCSHHHDHKTREERKTKKPRRY